MIKMITVFITLLFFCQQIAFSGELAIRKVTVYANSAEVNSVADINLKRGNNEVTFRRLSPYVDPATIQISGEGFRVLSISRGVDTVKDDAAYLDSLEMYEKQIQDLEKQKREKRSSFSILEMKEALLLSNQKLVGEGGLQQGELQTLLEYFFSRISEIEKQKLVLTEDMRDLDKEITDIEEMIENLQVPEEKLYSKVHFTLQADAPGSFPVEVRYSVGNAGWFPTYDIFARDDGIELYYNANIHQQTGSDWESVSVVVSSASPHKGQVVPRQMPYYLRFDRSIRIDAEMADHPTAQDIGIHQVRGKVTDASDGLPLPGVNVTVDGTTIGTVTDLDGEYSLQMPSEARILNFSFIGMEPKKVPISSSVLNVGLEPSMVALEEVMVVGYGVADRPSRRETREPRPSRPAAPPAFTLGYQTSISYEVEIPYDIPSTAEPTQVEVRRVTIPAEMRYQAVPGVEEAAFLTARIPEWEQYNLLDGEANLYMDNQFMGRTVLETSALEDTLSLSLGRDESITVKRQRQRDYEQRRTWSNRVREERVWQTAVRNNKEETIAMEIFDRIPVSRHSDIRVNVIDVSGGEKDEQTGIVKWIVHVEPGETERVQVHYSVEYPRDRRLFVE